jgi:hypothetical protein
MRFDRADNQPGIGAISRYDTQLLSDSQPHEQEDELDMKFLEENSLSEPLKSGDLIFSFAHYPGFS